MAKQQKNPNLPIRYQPTGGLSSDLSPLANQAGTYGDSLNLHFLTQLGSTTVTLENIFGNKFVFQLPTVQAQNVIFRIYLNYTSPYTVVNWDFYDGNGDIITEVQFTPATSLAATYSVAVGLIQSQLGAGNVVIGSLVTTSATTGYFTFEFSGGTSINYWGYNVTQSTGDAPVPIIIQEAYNTSLAGMLRFIGSFDLVGDGIIWSTPQTNLPSTIAVSGTSSSTGGVGGLVVITVPTNLLLINGMAVSIDGVTGTVQANGNWIIANVTQLATTTTFQLLGSDYVDAYTGGGTVNINTAGIGEIGVATLDVNTNLWSYTTLLRSKEFNFCTLTQIKCECTRSYIQANLYWTDNNNPYRRLYYIGDYEQNGALNYVDSANVYVYGDIDLATRLFSQNGLAQIGLYHKSEHRFRILYAERLAKSFG